MIHSLFDKVKQEQKEKDKVKHLQGGTGEFYCGNQVHVSNRNKTIVPFTGNGHRLVDKDKRTNWQIIKYYVYEIHLYLIRLLKALLTRMLAYFFN